MPECGVIFDFYTELKSVPVHKLADGRFKTDFVKFVSLKSNRTLFVNVVGFLSSELGLHRPYLQAHEKEYMDRRHLFRIRKGISLAYTCHLCWSDAPYMVNLDLDPISVDTKREIFETISLLRDKIIEEMGESWIDDFERMISDKNRGKFRGKSEVWEHAAITYPKKTVNNLVYGKEGWNTIDGQMHKVFSNTILNHIVDLESARWAHKTVLECAKIVDNMIPESAMDEFSFVKELVDQTKESVLVYEVHDE